MNYELSEKLEKIYQIARNRLKLSSDRMKTYYDIGTKIQNFDKGSAVWLHNPHRTK